jgi:hypothetical protein
LNELKKEAEWPLRRPGLWESWLLAAPEQELLLDDDDFVVDDPPHTASEERGKDEGE